MDARKIFQTAYRSKNFVTPIIVRFLHNGGAGLVAEVSQSDPEDALLRALQAGNPALEKRFQRLSALARAGRI
jgi:hypothetical protein